MGFPRPRSIQPRSRFSIWGKIRKIPTQPNPNPQIFRSIFDMVAEFAKLVPARRSGLKKAARGCHRIQIWSHQGPNQSQNHVFERSRCQPGKGKGKRQREEKGKGKGQTTVFFPDLTRHTHRAHARHETKRFPGWSHPPTSDESTGNEVSGET